MFEKRHQDNPSCHPIFLLGGEMEVVDAFEMVKAMVPEFYVEEALDNEERYSVCAVFCRADYQKSPAHASLNHWIPAGLKEELADPSVHLKNARSAAEKKLVKEKKKLEKRKKECQDDAEACASVETYLEHVEITYQNFFVMQQVLYDAHGLVCRHVEGDGNCGCYMLLALIRDVPEARLEPAAAHEFRQELGKLWEDHASLPMWQAVWRRLRHRLGSNQPADPSTPDNKIKKKKKSQQGEPFTPDNVKGRKRLLPTAGGVLVGGVCFNGRSQQVFHLSE